MPLKNWNDLLTEAGDAAEGYEILPASDYDMKIVKSEAKMASTGKLMFAITTEVTAGPYKGRKVWANIVLSDGNPTALGIFFRQMNALGIDKSFFAPNPSDSQVAEALLNKEFRGQVGIKAYNGSDRNEIKNYFPKSSTETSVPPPPPTIPQAANPAPAPAAAQTPVAPAPPAPAAAVAPPAPAPPPAAPAAPAPVQPAVPPVPDMPATPPAPPAPPVAAAPASAEAPAAPAPAVAETLPPPPPPAGSPF